MGQSKIDLTGDRVDMIMSLPSLSCIPYSQSLLCMYNIAPNACLVRRQGGSGEMFIFVDMACTATPFRFFADEERPETTSVSRFSHIPKTLLPTLS